MADFLEDAKGVRDAHDKFFKMTFSNELDTRAFIDKFFPKDIREHIDLDSVKLIDNEKLTKGYKKYQLDLSFDCKFKGKESKFYLIFEHKSALDKFVLLQILNYMVVTWETNLKQNKDLIPIIPVIFYQGKEKWNMSEEFSDQFKSIKSDKDLSFLSKYLPKFKHILFDTKNLSNSMIEEGLKENISLYFKLAALKYCKSGNKDESEELKKIFALVYHSIKEQGLDLLNEEILIVINYVSINYGPEKTQELISEIGGEEELITLTKKWKMEGKEEGKIEGKMEGMLLDAQDMVLNAIEAKFDAFSPEIESKVKSISDRERLKNIMKAMFKINSIKELEELL